MITSTFILLSKAWYADANLRGAKHLDNVCISVYDDERFLGNIEFFWYEVGRAIAPRIEAFDDTWYALSKSTDLMELMASLNGKSIKPAAFCEALVAIGMKDDTPTEVPKHLADLRG